MWRIVALIYLVRASICGNATTAPRHAALFLDFSKSLNSTTRNLALDFSQLLSEELETTDIGLWKFDDYPPETFHSFNESREELKKHIDEQRQQYASVFTRVEGMEQVLTVALEVIPAGVAKPTVVVITDGRYATHGTRTPRQRALDADCLGNLTARLRNVSHFFVVLVGADALPVPWAQDAVSVERSSEIRGAVTSIASRMCKESTDKTEAPEPASPEALHPVVLGVIIACVVAFLCCFVLVCFLCGRQYKEGKKNEEPKPTKEQLIGVFQQGYQSILSNESEKLRESRINRSKLHESGGKSQQQRGPVKCAGDNQLSQSKRDANKFAEALSEAIKKQSDMHGSRLEPSILKGRKPNQSSLKGSKPNQSSLKGRKPNQSNLHGSKPNQLGVHDSGVTDASLHESRLTDPSMHDGRLTVSSVHDSHSSMSKRGRGKDELSQSAIARLTASLLLSQPTA